MRCDCGAVSQDGSNYCSKCGRVLRVHRHTTGIHQRRAQHMPVVPIDRLLEKVHKQMDQNRATTLEDPPHFSDPHNEAFKSPYYGVTAATQLGLLFNQAIDEVKLLQSRWELIAYAGQVHLCGDPYHKRYVLFMPYRQKIEARDLERLVKQAVYSRNGHKLVRAMWVLSPVLWGDMEGAKRLYGA